MGRVWNLIIGEVDYWADVKKTSGPSEDNRKSQEQFSPSWVASLPRAICSAASTRPKFAKNENSRRTKWKGHWTGQRTDWLRCWGNEFLVWLSFAFSPIAFPFEQATIVRLVWIQGHRGEKVISIIPIVSINLCRLTYCFVNSTAVS